MTTLIEAQPNERCLMVFDGTVLEIFGQGGPHRLHGGRGSSSPTASARG